MQKCSEQKIGVMENIITTDKRWENRTNVSREIRNEEFQLCAVSSGVIDRMSRHELNPIPHAMQSRIHVHHISLHRKKSGEFM
jgi:hypothetical protein